ncbi:hypothetical protein DFQ30_003113 [Apophysomyces sp. BC1015]|nr:hypothetical protein DFQ30_003113 [Apophysomyces sp. BC1015]
MSIARKYVVSIGTDLMPQFGILLGRCEEEIPTPDASPAALVHLPTPEGQTVFRCQYRLAEKQNPLIKETIEKWEADGVMRELPL